VNAELRPLGIGEILDAGIKLFMRHWRPLALSVVGLILPVQILSALITASVAPEQFDITSSESGVDEGEEAEFLVGQLIILVLTVVTVLIATAVCFKAVADAYMGVEPDWRRSLRFAVRRFWALLGLAIVGGLLILLGFLALVIPGIWLAVAYSVAVPALLLERAGPIQSLRRSFRLVRKRWWPTAGALLVGYVLTAIVGGIVQAVVLFLPALLAEGNTLAGAFGSVVGSTLGLLITTPYSAAVVTLVYFDLRVRKEGLDLQLIAEGTGVERDPDAPLPAPLTAEQYTPEERAQAPYWPPPPGWRPAAAAPSWSPAATDAPQASGWLPPRPPGTGGARPPEDERLSADAGGSRAAAADPGSSDDESSREAGAHGARPAAAGPVSSDDSSRELAEPGSGDEPPGPAPA
jgi:hypothetical protein